MSLAFVNLLACVLLQGKWGGGCVRQRDLMADSQGRVRCSAIFQLTEAFSDVRPSPPILHQCFEAAWSADLDSEIPERLI